MWAGVCGVRARQLRRERETRRQFICPVFRRGESERKKK